MFAQGLVKRPVVRWFGGKWKLADWIIAHFPVHRIYVEPFGGGGSVLLRKPRVYAEIYNDLDDEIVNLFRVLRDDVTAARLVQQLRLTPFARRELEAAYEISEDPVERARRLVVLSFMGWGSNAHARISTGFRASSSRSGTTPALDWMNYPDALVGAVDRLRGVTIDHRDALEVSAQHDTDETLHYFDPPYVHATRSRHDRQRSYTHEMTDADHEGLLAFVRELKGMVILSGYPHPLYDAVLSDWRRVERPAFADGGRARTEVLWLNRAAVVGLAGGPLLAVGT